MIKVGDLVFVGGGGLIANAVKIVSAGRTYDLAKVPDHVAIVSAVYSDAVVLLEANFKRVELVDLKIYSKCILWFARMKEPRDIMTGLKWAHKHFGKRYDKMAIVGILARSVFRLFGPRIYDRVRFMKNLLNQKTAFFCSELVSGYGRKTGKDLWRHPDSVTTPWDLKRSEEIEIYEVRYGNIK